MDEAFQAMIAKARGASSTGVDVVILRATFLQPSIAPTTVIAKKPLTLRSVRVDRLRAGEGSFNMRSWIPGNLLAPYWPSVESGTLLSSAPNGAIY